MKIDVKLSIGGTSDLFISGTASLQKGCPIFPLLVSDVESIGFHDLKLDL